MENQATVATAMLALAVVLSGCTQTSVNRPPSVTSSEPGPEVTMTEGGTLRFAVEATDPDGQPLTCRWYVDGNQSLVTRPPFILDYAPGRAVGDHQVRAVVSDGSLTASKAWRVTVLPVDRPPVIVTDPPGSGPLAVNEGGALLFTVNAKDPEGAPVSLRWTLDGATVLEGGASYRFEPDFGQSGAHIVSVHCSDGNSTTSHAWDVTVVDVNRAPRLTSWSPPSDIHIRELDTQEFCATASDEDGDRVVLNWSLDGEPATTGPSFLLVTGYLSAGDHVVSVEAGDGRLSASHSWAVRVDNLNRPPRVSGHEPPVDAATTEFGPVTFRLDGADDDDDALSVSWFVDNGTVPASTGTVFNWTPGYGSAGNHTVSAVLSDGTESVSRSWNVTVTRAVADWTVLVYMNADNDLEPYLVEDLNEMEQVGSSSNLSVVVQADRCPGYDKTDGDWNGTRRYRVESDDDPRLVGSRMLEDLGELDMGDGRTLQDFLLWGLEHFPARRFLIVLSGHGDGWQGISQDFTDGNDRLSVEELAGAMGAFSKARGAPADVLLLDVCYWAMLETGWGLRETASFIVGSEDIDPSAGQPYDGSLGVLAASPDISPRELARRLVEVFGSEYSGGAYPPQEADTFTLSAVDTSGLEALAVALDRLCEVAAGNMSTAGPELQSARAGTGSFGKPEFIDLYDLVARWRSRSTLAALNETAEAVLAAINATVVAESHGSLRTFSRGVSIYFPAVSSAYRASYGDLAFSRAHSWDMLLDAYYNAAGRGAGGISDGDAPAGRASPSADSPRLSVSESKGLSVNGADILMLAVKGGD
ncbi:MAG: hypothetical protein FJ149_00025 [Euryarchaeota archaeon]|nr:hypothetical protein [Euryarchaeota archaeon]